MDVITLVLLLALLGWACRGDRPPPPTASPSQRRADLYFACGPRSRA